MLQICIRKMFLFFLPFLWLARTPEVHWLSLTSKRDIIAVFYYCYTLVTEKIQIFHLIVI